MGTTNKQPKATDYAVAMELNEHVDDIFYLIALYQELGHLSEFDPDELNRAYILLVNELEILYGRNPKLVAIEPKPLWMKFDVIKDKLYEIQKYLDKHKVVGDHTLRVEKLCIISGQEQEAYELSSTQKKHIEYKNKIVRAINAAESDPSKRSIKQIAEDELEKNRDPRDKRFWCIHRYDVIYKPDGTILINEALKLKKAHAGSSTERLLEQALKSPNKLFKPNIGQTSRNLSTVLSSAGFTSTLRDIFFPVVSESKGVMFRPTVTREEVQQERIDTYELDTLLFNVGAQVAVRPKDELIALNIVDPDDFDDED